MGDMASKCCGYSQVAVPATQPVMEPPRTDHSVAAPPRQVEAAPNPKKLSLRDFMVMGELGQGGYGKVHLAKRLATQEHVAIKVIPKSLLQKGKDGKVTVEEILSEKEIMIKHDNPFLVKLQGSFQDDGNLYFVMELLHGGNLYSYLHQSQKARLSEEVTRFYAAEVVMGLEHLHDRMHIIYRDLKPENILLAQDGHIKLADFGLAKRADSLQGDVKGTPDFIAPEVYNQQPFNHMIDYWSLGCLIFEMLFGKPAFCDEGNIKSAVRIKVGKFTFPSEIKVSEEAKSLIRRLLDVNPQSRLGAGGIQEIKNHPFFSPVDWNKMFRKEVAPPFGKLTMKFSTQPSKINLNGPKGERVEGFTYMPESPQISRAD